MKNPNLAALVLNGPMETTRPKGAGMSLRPEFYSGRGVGYGDVTPTHLQIIYEGLNSREALGQFPKGAAEAFLLLVLRMPALTGTAFVTSLLALDANDYVFDEKLVSTSNIDVGPDDGTGARQMVAMATVFSMFGGESDPATDQRLSVGLKKTFLLKLGNLDFYNEKVKQIWQPPMSVQRNELGYCYMDGSYPDTCRGWDGD